MTEGYLAELRNVVQRLHCAEARHTETVQVSEAIQGETVWEGQVEVFQLIGHPRARNAYAWVCKADDPFRTRRYVTVLQVPPVTSAAEAVKAALAREYSTFSGSDDIYEM